MIGWKVYISKHVSAKNENIRYISNTSLYNDLEELMNKELGCWCTPEPCHGNVLVMLLEEKLAQLQNKY